MMISETRVAQIWVENFQVLTEICRRPRIESSIETSTSLNFVLRLTDFKSLSNVWLYASAFPVNVSWWESVRPIWRGKIHTIKSFFKRHVAKSHHRFDEECEREREKTSVHGCQCHWVSPHARFGSWPQRVTICEETKEVNSTRFPKKFATPVASFGWLYNVQWIWNAPIKIDINASQIYIVIMSEKNMYTKCRVSPKFVSNGAHRTTYVSLQSKIGEKKTRTWLLYGNSNIFVGIIFETWSEQKTKLN